MKTVIEICLDHDSSAPGASADATLRIAEALGHGPGFKLKADNQADIVNGRIIAVMFCDTRTLGEDALSFKDGRVELASADNVDNWFREQGHRLMKIKGDKAFGNTIVYVQITEEDEEPTRLRQTTLRRPEVIPDAASLCAALTALDIRSIDEIKADADRVAGEAAALKAAEAMPRAQFERA